MHDQHLHQDTHTATHHTIAHLIPSHRTAKFRSTQKLGPTAGITVLRGAALTYQRCGRHGCPQGWAGCAWRSQTDIHRESSSSTRRKRAKNKEDAVAQRVRSQPSPSPSLTTEQTRTHCTHRTFPRNPRAPCTLQTTQEPPPTALLIVARPPTLQHPHDPAFGLHLTIPHLSPPFTQANVVTGHAQFILLPTKTLRYLEQVEMLQKNDTRENERVIRGGMGGAQPPPSTAHPCHHPLALPVHLMETASDQRVDEKIMLSTHARVKSRRSHEAHLRVLSTTTATKTHKRHLR